MQTGDPAGLPSIPLTSLPLPGAYCLQVTITIEEKDKGNTVVKLVQTGIPDQDKFGHHDVVSTTEKGWKGQIFHRIRAVFGYGL